MHLLLNFPWFFDSCLDVAGIAMIATMIHKLTGDVTGNVTHDKI